MSFSKFPYRFPAMWLLSVWCISVGAIHAQTPAEQARLNAVEALRLQNEGRFAEAANLLIEAMSLDPAEINYPYEVAHMYYLQKRYDQAVKYLEPLLSHPKVNELVFQLLGNSYDFMKKMDLARKTYLKGIELFPQCGMLHMEMGIMYMLDEDYEYALDWYSKGITAEPVFPGNYYWMARVHLVTENHLWALVYGETFMNLERNSARASEMSKWLFDLYKTEYLHNADSTLVGNLLASSSKLDLAKGRSEDAFIETQFEPLMMLAAMNGAQADLTAMHEVRESFLRLITDKKYSKEKIPAIFSYQRKMLDAGHLEAYNHWLLRKGDTAGWNRWYEGHWPQFKAFSEWFRQHPLMPGEADAPSYK